MHKWSYTRNRYLYRQSWLFFNKWPNQCCMFEMFNITLPGFVRMLCTYRKNHLYHVTLTIFESTRFIANIIVSRRLLLIGFQFLCSQLVNREMRISWYINTYFFHYIPIGTPFSLPDLLCKISSELKFTSCCRKERHQRDVRRRPWKRTTQKGLTSVALTKRTTVHANRFMRSESYALLRNSGGVVAIIH